MNIRRANIDDIPVLLPLLSELGYPCIQQNLSSRFEKFLKNPGYGVAIYETNSEIVGLIAWSRSDLFISDKVRVHIDGLVVAYGHRGRGIGKKLMMFVEDVAKQHSPVIVDLTSSLKRAKDGSHEFYKKLGYKNEGPMAKLYLRKEL